MRCRLPLALLVAAALVALCPTPRTRRSSASTMPSWRGARSAAALVLWLLLTGARRAAAGRSRAPSAAPRCGRR